MSNNLGTSLVLSTNATKLYSGLSEAANKMKTWASGVTSSVTGQLGGIGGKLAASLKGGIATMAASFGTGVFTGAIDQIKELAAVGKQAKSLGIASDQFIGLTSQLSKFGVEGGEAVKLFAKLGAKTTEAASGNKELAAVFKSIGLDAAQLKGQSLDKQFIALADGISKLPSAGEQARVAMKLFEEAGVKALPMLQKSGPEIQKQIDKLKALGVALGDADMSKLMRAQQALPKLGLAFDGLRNKVLVAIAPIIEVISSKITKAAEKLAPVFEWVGRAVSTYWGIIADVVGEVVEGIWDVITAAGEWLGSFLNLSSVSSTVEEAITAVFKGIGIAGAYAWDTLKAGLGFVTIGVGLLVKGLGEAIKLFGKLTGVGLETGEATKRMGDDLIKWGMKQPTKFGESAEQVRKWFEKRANKKPEELEKSGKMQSETPKAVESKYTAVGAMLKGSREAYSLETKFRAESALNPQLDLQRKQLDEQKRANQKADEMIGAIRANSGVNLGMI